MSNFLFKVYKALISFLLIFVPFSKLREFIRIYAYIKRDVMPISPFHALFSKIIRNMIIIYLFWLVQKMKLIICRNG